MKLSVLALYYRIFAAYKFRIIIIITAVVVVSWLLAMEILLGLGCRPVQGWWDATVAATATCVDKVAFTYSTNITNLLTDIWIFLMPIPIILGLQASRDKKIGLCFLFSVGLGTCAISAARLSVVFTVGTEDITCRVFLSSSLLFIPAVLTWLRGRGPIGNLVGVGALRWHLVCKLALGLQGDGSRYQPDSLNNEIISISDSDSRH